MAWTPPQHLSPSWPPSEQTTMFAETKQLIRGGRRRRRSSAPEDVSDEEGEGVKTSKAPLNLK